MPHTAERHAPNLLTEQWRLAAPDRDLSNDDLLDDGLVHVALALWALGDHLALDDKLALLVLFAYFECVFLLSAPRRAWASSLRASGHGRNRNWVRDEARRHVPPTLWFALGHHCAGETVRRATTEGRWRRGLT